MRTQSSYHNLLLVNKCVSHENVSVLRQSKNQEDGTQRD